ncbi:MAG TPA: hypothetical protein VKR53_19305 [Puia sp.]|nr:hypothetical protein [Puia sp.]
MPVTTCTIDSKDYRLEYYKDISDDSFSGILHMEPPVLFSFSDTVFLPSIKMGDQQTIRNAIAIHQEAGAGNQKMS